LRETPHTLLSGLIWLGIQVIHQVYKESYESAIQFLILRTMIWSLFCSGGYNDFSYEFIVCRC
jgi:hypothetical protein